MKRRRPTIGHEHDAPGRVRITGPFTQEQLARLYRCPRESISVIERRAIAKLREAAAGHPELAAAMRFLLCRAPKRPRRGRPRKRPSSAPA